MNTGHVLLDILVLLVAAKVAAELAERVRLPAVLGEINAVMFGLVYGFFRLQNKLTKGGIRSDELDEIVASTCPRWACLPTRSSTWLRTISPRSPRARFLPRCSSPPRESAVPAESCSVGAAAFGLWSQPICTVRFSAELVNAASMRVRLETASAASTGTGPKPRTA